jgi:N-glycosylase/DNA lyase
VRKLGGPGALDLGRTLASGQTFRWRWWSDGAGATCAEGIVGRTRLRVRQDAAGLWLESPWDAAAAARCRRYFGLAPDPDAVRRRESALAADPVLAAILPHTAGLAMLRQDPWETLISFIISANNNIPKIGRSIERPARALGEPIGGGDFAFPAPERLAGARLRTLQACLLGYRAPYVHAAARMVADGRVALARYRDLPLDDARAGLLEIPGIGSKVADCILLFGLSHGAAFPVDVWVARAVSRLYFSGQPRPPREIQAFARARFGALAGAAQQHLFCYARTHLAAKSKGPASRPVPPMVAPLALPANG